MDELKHYTALGYRLLKRIDSLLQEEKWGDTLFLRASKKRILQIRQSIGVVLDQIDDNEAKLSHNKNQFYTKPGQIPVYISLYQAQGRHIVVWQEVLRSLAKSSIGRPIYQDEKHVIQLIREHGNPPQEGYVIVYVDKQSVLSVHDEQAKKDHFGHPLFTLKEGAIKPEFFYRFIHANQHAYAIHNGFLVPEPLSLDDT